MMRCITKHIALAIVALMMIGTTKAQSTLPDIEIFSQKGVNVINWICPYDGIKSIAVQRSNDSIYNFTTIGYVKNTAKGAQAFVDGHPTPGKNYYRLYIAFSSDLTWYSNRVRIFVDSAQLMQQAVMPPNDSLQRMVNTLSLGNNPSNVSSIPEYNYVRSQYVFTNPFTGHINIELPDTYDKQAIYSLVFYNDKNRKVLEIDKMSESSLVLDKHNFQRKGIYKFELTKNRTLLEKGFVTIY